VHPLDKVFDEREPTEVNQSHEILPEYVTKAELKSTIDRLIRELRREFSRPVKKEITCNYLNYFKYLRYLQNFKKLMNCLQNLGRNNERRLRVQGWPPQG